MVRDKLSYLVLFIQSCILETNWLAINLTALKRGKKVSFTTRNVSVFLSNENYFVFRWSSQKNFLA